MKLKLTSLVLIVGWTNAALFGEQCSDSSSCTDLNTYCYKYRDCGVGTCQCISRYGNANGNACDKVLKHYNQPCDSENICLDPNQECSSTTGLCACTKWNSYSSLAQQCITVTRYLSYSNPFCSKDSSVLTETCGGWWALECYISETAGGLCEGTCRCQEGYTMAVHETYLACRAPQYGEYCTSSVSCQVSFDTRTISDDVSSHAPTCLLNVCLCPPSHELKVVMGHNFCLRKADDDDLKANGETCTSFNECQSSLCVKCVGSTTGVCMADDDATSLTPNSLLVAAFLIILLTIV